MPVDLSPGTLQDVLVKLCMLPLSTACPNNSMSVQPVPLSNRHDTVMERWPDSFSGSPVQTKFGIIADITLAHSNGVELSCFR